MLTREEAIAHIQATCGSGWSNLIEIIYDNVPENIVIKEVFQKWGGLKVSFEGENMLFEELVDTVYAISQKMCEKCGKSGGYAILDGWETTLCREHFNTSAAAEKWKERK